MASCSWAKVLAEINVAKSQASNCSKRIVEDLVGKVFVFVHRAQSATCNMQCAQCALRCAWCTRGKLEGCGKTAVSE